MQVQWDAAENSDESERVNDRMILSKIWWIPPCSRGDIQDMH
jgi:hypothetical protein